MVFRSINWTRTVCIGGIFGGSWLLARFRFPAELSRVRSLVAHSLGTLSVSMSESWRLWRSRGLALWTLVESCRTGGLGPVALARLESSVDSLGDKLNDSCALFGRQLENRLEASESALRQDVGTAIHDLALEQTKFDTVIRLFSSCLDEATARLNIDLPRVDAEISEQTTHLQRLESQVDLLVQDFATRAHSLSAAFAQQTREVAQSIAVEQAQREAVEANLHALALSVPEQLKEIARSFTEEESKREILHTDLRAVATSVRGILEELDEASCRVLALEPSDRGSDQERHELFVALAESQELADSASAGAGLTRGEVQAFVRELLQEFVQETMHDSFQCFLDDQRISFVDYVQELEDEAAERLYSRFGVQDLPNPPAPRSALLFPFSPSTSAAPVRDHASATGEEEEPLVSDVVLEAPANAGPSQPRTRRGRRARPSQAVGSLDEDATLVTDGPCSAGPFSMERAINEPGGIDHHNYMRDPGLFDP